MRGEAKDFVVQVRFFQVSEEELERQRKQFHTGQISIKIEETTFSMRCVPS